jgi:predicted lipoprotein with Yx(FWY)xxD motif
VSAENVGALGTVLVDSRGFTLYRLTGETASNIMCTGGCAQTWPPLEASGSPKAGQGATGKIGIVKRSDGITQVTYDGVPLYRYAADSKPGQANGEGVAGVWFAVTPAGESAKGGSAGGGMSPTGGGYNR